MAKVEVLRGARQIEKPNLQRHPAFHDPSPRLGAVEPSHEPFEHGPSAQPVHNDPGLLRLGLGSLVESSA